MRTRAVVAGGLLALAGVWAISAVGQAMISGPAETPPLTYQGREYVDSKGCMFIRAGVDGNVVWVPRVDSNRELVCGFTPTFSPTELAAANAGGPMISTQGNASAIAISDTMAVSSAGYATGPGLVNDIFVPSGGGMASAGTTPAAPSVGGSRVVNDIFVPSGGAAPVTYVSEGSTYTAGGSRAPALSGGGRVVNDVHSGGGSVVGDIYVGGSAGVTYGGGSPLAIGIPNRSTAPFGYRQAWDDGRLNPNRGPRSSTGDQSMYSVWTSDVPMQLASDAGSQRRGLQAINPFR